jgi:hypothetical protein
VPPRIVRVDTHSRTKLRNRAVHVASVSERGAEIAVRQLVIRVETDRGAVFRNPGSSRHRGLRLRHRRSGDRASCPLGANHYCTSSSECNQVVPDRNDEASLPPLRKALNITEIRWPKEVLRQRRALAIASVWPQFGWQPFAKRKLLTMIDFWSELRMCNWEGLRSEASVADLSFFERRGEDPHGICSFP